MKHVNFIVRKHYDLGICGLVPAGVCLDDNYYPISTSGTVAHDIVEHQNGFSEIGSVEDELEAVGAMWLIRGQFDDFARPRPGHYIHPYDVLQMEVADLIDRRDMMPCPRVKGHGLEGDFKRAVSDAGASLGISDEQERNAVRYMILGARKAERRFGDEMAANTQYWMIDAAVREKLGDNFDTLEKWQTFRLSWGKGKATFTETTDYGYESINLMP